MGVKKLKRLFICDSCGRPSSQWTGRCTACGSWGSISDHPAGSGAPTSGRVRPVLTLAPDSEDRRISTGLGSVDRVLGGGLVSGSVVLLAGAPGIGKSTLLLQLVSRLHESGHPCLLASGEESRGQVAARARRLGIGGETLGFVPGRDLADVLGAARAERPHVLVVDSIQTIRSEDSETLPGGVGQVRACADALIALAKEEGVTVLLIGHVTKDGDLGGPRTLEHAVDTVLTFEGDPRSGLRVLVGGKNRFGPEGEVAWFEMTSQGLLETDGEGALRTDGPETGCATGVVLAGRRAFAVDVQALVVPSEGPPKRQVSGLDPRRFHIVAAVLDRTLGLRLGRCELFGASAGGLRLDDPGTDLAVAAALASASVGWPPPPNRGFVGELSLTGTVRPVAAMEARVSAARAAGLREVVAATGRGRDTHNGGPEGVMHVSHLREALSWAIGRGS